MNAMTAATMRATPLTVPPAIAPFFARVRRALETKASLVGAEDIDDIEGGCFAVMATLVGASDAEGNVEDDRPAFVVMLVGKDTVETTEENCSAPTTALMSTNAIEEFSCNFSAVITTFAGVDATEELKDGCFAAMTALVSTDGEEAIKGDGSAAIAMLLGEDAIEEVEDRCLVDATMLVSEDAIEEERDDRSVLGKTEAIEGDTASDMVTLCSQNETQCRRGNRQFTHTKPSTSPHVPTCPLDVVPGKIVRLCVPFVSPLIPQRIAEFWSLVEDRSIHVDGPPSRESRVDTGGLYPENKGDI